MRTIDTPNLVSINTATFGYQWPIKDTVELLARKGVGGLAPWRREVDANNVDAVSRQIRDAGLRVSGFCRTTYLTAANAAERQAAIEDNKIALEHAAKLEAACYVAVVGGLPEGSRDLAATRTETVDSLTALAEAAKQVGVPIALEPLHPMYAADRSCLNSLAQAIDWCDSINAAVPESVGIAADIYHLWWDPDLHADIRRAGERIIAYHVSDWLVPTKDFLTDRGMMGDGVVDLPAIRRTIEDEAGFTGLVEVEIFSAENWWKRPPPETLAVCLERCMNCV